MRAVLKLGPVRIESVGRDRYGRLFGVAYAGRINVNCHMLTVPRVRYISRYDSGGQVARVCR